MRSCYGGSVLGTFVPLPFVSPLHAGFGKLLCMEKGYTLSDLIRVAGSCWDALISYIL